MAKKEEQRGGRVVILLPVVPKLPSGVVDMGTITRLISEAELANNPPEETTESELPSEKTDAEKSTTEEDQP